MSNLILILCLLIGFLLGYISKPHLSGKAHGRVMMVTVLLLLFIMGALLGAAPDLGKRVAVYGYNAFIIVMLAMLSGAFVVWLLVKLVRVKR